MVQFNPYTHICCKGYVRPLLGLWFLNKCCGTLNYNRRKYWCCAGKLRRNILGRVTARPSCCGRRSYNPTTQRCCNGMVTSSNLPYYIPYSCCERKSFNPFTKTCCGGKVQPLTGSFRHTQCCGTNVYNEMYEKCCAGKWQDGVVIKMWKNCTYDNNALGFL